MTRSYLLREIPDTLWSRVKARAAGEGRSLRYVVLRLLGDYARRGFAREVGRVE